MVVTEEGGEYRPPVAVSRRLHTVARDGAQHRQATPARTHGVFFLGAGLGLRDGDFAFFFAGVLLVATICAR